jgi:hypothetical protein
LAHKGDRESFVLVLLAEADARNEQIQIFEQVQEIEHAHIQAHTQAIKPNTRASSITRNFNQKINIESATSNQN